MRLLVTADLHYDSPRSRSGVVELCRRVGRACGDALVLVGDSAGAAHQHLRDCLALFAGFPGRKFMVPGNHCLWCLPGEDSLTRYEKTIPTIAAEAGFSVLDHAPAVIEGVGLVGSIGWYDYSYRDQRLEIPLEFYQAKVTPGAAARLEKHRGLIETFSGRLTPRHYELGIRWMDGVHVRLGMSDGEFLDRVLERLAAHLGELERDESVRQVVAFVHHLPFGQLVPQDRPPHFAFAAAYMGSDRIGETLLACRKLTHVFCGHSHWKDAALIGGVRVVNVGSTYVEKRLETLDL